MLKNKKIIFSLIAIGLIAASSIGLNHRVYAVVTGVGGSGSPTTTSTTSCSSTTTTPSSSSTPICNTADNCSSGSSSCCNAQNCDLIQKYVNPFIDFLAAGVGIVVVIMIVIGGIQYITSQDNPQAVSAAKSRIVNALFALVLFALMWSLLQWLVPGGLLNG